MVPVSWLSYRPIKVSLVRLPREGGMVPDRLFPPMSSCWSKGSLERKGGTGPETPVLLMVRDRSFFSFVSWGGMGPTRAGRSENQMVSRAERSPTAAGIEPLSETELLSLKK
ncbi:polygalacturonase inhibitor-like [Iris pallida]|uniref:Polygalacturonase inhibitor-like n=1 Tax=Iris pallida TaxID=29817 RepID=A0AAX6GKJ7_IRIPA|nr:polygalacturonase inhibitor-like [Iris pallida]KAJ6848112.1 polygalacturonase inhibitor-like [Iris pallida]